MPEERDQKPQREIIYLPAPRYTHQEEDEIDLIELWNVLWYHKWFIVCFVVLCTAIAAIVPRYINPPQYQARATLQATKESKQVITNYLNSNKLVKRMANKYDLLPKLYPEKWDKSKGTWKVNGDEVPTIDGVMRGDGLPLQVNSENNKVTITWEGEDPHLCSNMLDRALQVLRTYLQEDYVTTAQTKLELYKQELTNLNQIIQKTIVQNTSNLDSQDFLQSLSRYIELKENMLQIRSKDKLSRQFYVIDEPAPPKNPVNTKTKLIVGLSFVLSLFVAVFLVFFLRFTQTAKQRRMETRG